MFILIYVYYNILYLMMTCTCVFMWFYLWGPSLWTGSMGKPCCQPSGWQAQCGVSSAEPHKTDYTKKKKKNQALHKNTNRKWTIAKHLEGFQLVLLFTVTFAARYSSTERNCCRQCLCYIIKCLHCVTVHFMKKIVQPAAYPRYWKQGHALHKQANPAIILYAYQQATL